MLLRLNEVASHLDEVASSLGEVAQSKADQLQLDELIATQNSLEQRKVDESRVVGLVTDSIHGERVETLTKRLEAMSLSRAEEGRLRGERIRETTDRLSELALSLGTIQEQIDQRLDEVARSKADKSILDELISQQSALEARKVDEARVVDLVTNSIHGQQVETLTQRFEAMSLSRAEEARQRSLRIREAADSEAAIQSSMSSIQGRIEETAGQKASTASVDDLAQRVALLGTELTDRFGSLETDLGDKVGTLGNELADGLERFAGFDDRLHDYRLGLLEEQRRVSLLLEESRKRLPKPMAPSQIEEMVREQDHLLDSMYSSLEDRFRGTRAEIKGKLAIYVPRVAQAVADTDSGPIVDLGCGRGEWLELLANESLEAVGVDINHTMIRRCEEADLTAVDATAIEFLRDQRASTLGAVTAFHLLEHVPFGDLVGILDESVRVLRPGGIAIFETPNPENLSVSATGFYADPTHRNPLFPPTMQFLLEQRGFVRVEIVRPYPRPIPEWMQPLPSDDPAAGRINAILDLLRSLFQVSPDYAVIGYKA